MELIDFNLDRIHELCKTYKVKTLYAFGSILTNRFRKGSDVDLLVNFEKQSIDISDYADNFYEFQFALEDLFNRKVDLVCYDAIKNPLFRQEVDSKKQIIYG